MPTVGGSSVHRLRRRSGGCGRVSNGIVALAMMLLLVLPSHRANAEIFTAIAITASVLSALISLGDTGADPGGEMTAKNRQTLKHLHKRLDGHDEAFKTILEKLDVLPKEIRREIDEALINERIVNVRTSITLILEDIEILKQLRSEEIQRGDTDLTPIADAAIRLDKLQTAVRNLIQSTDDMIMFDVIAARYIEQALIAIQGGIESDVDWSVRMVRYQKRFDKVTHGSPHSQEKTFEKRKLKIEKNADEYLHNWMHKEIIPAIKHLYTASTNSSSIICGTKHKYTITDQAKRAQTKMNDPNNLKKMQTLDFLRSFYEYAISVVQYESDLLLPKLQTQDFPQIQTSR